MPESDDSLSVDTEALERGGVNIKHLGIVTSTVFGDLFNVTNKWGRRLGGDPGSDIDKALVINYYPAADASLSFLRGLKDLVTNNGDTTSFLGKHFNNVNTTTTTEAGGEGPTTGHRH